MTPFLGVPPGVSSPHALREHARAVAGGARALTIAGNCECDPDVTERVQALLLASRVPGAAPFLLDRGDRTAVYGYVASAWAFELYRWALKDADARVPMEHRRRIIGLLLGQSVQQIGELEVLATIRTSGRPPRT